MHLRDLDAVGAEARHRERRLGGGLGRPEARQFLTVADGERIGALPDSNDSYGRAAGRQDERGGPVRDGAAVKEAEGVCDEAARHHGAEGHWRAEVRVRVPDGVGMVLHGHLGDLARAESAPSHQGPGDQARQGRHGRAVRPLVRVDRPADNLRDPRRRQVRHALPADDEDRAGGPGGDRGEAGIDRRRSRGRRRLDANGRHVRESQVGGDAGREVALAEEFLRIHRGDDDRVRHLDPGRGQRRAGGVRHEVGQTLRAATKRRHAGPADPDAGHRGLEDRRLGRRASTGAEDPPAPPWRRDRDAEPAHETEQVRALEAEHVCGQGAVAPHPAKGHLDELSLELRDRAVEASRLTERGDGTVGEPWRGHGATGRATPMPRPGRRKVERLGQPAGDGLHRVPGSAAAGIVHRAGLGVTPSSPA